MSPRLPDVGSDRLRVLLVEDEEALARAYVRALRHAADLLVCDDVQSACRALEEEPFDVVLSDLHLPGGLGTRVLEVARRRHVPWRVLVSAWPCPPAAVEGASPLAHVFLEKPVGVDVLRRVVLSSGPAVAARPRG